MGTSQQTALTFLPSLSIVLAHLCESSRVEQMAGRSIKSAERTLALLELFSQKQTALTVGEVARDLGIPQASVSMLLRNLSDLGYLEYESRNRTYAPSIRVALLGAWIGRKFGDAGALSSHLNDICKMIGETSFIGIQNGPFAQYVLVQRIENPQRLNVDSGMFRPLTASAVGRILLSIRADEEVRRWVRRCNAEASDVRFKVREGDFLHLMATVRRNGYAETVGDVSRGLGAVTVHVPSPIGELELAIGCGGPIERMTSKKNRIVDALLELQEIFTKSPLPQANIWSS